MTQTPAVEAEDVPPDDVELSAWQRFRTGATTVRSWTGARVVAGALLGGAFVVLVDPPIDMNWTELAPVINDLAPIATLTAASLAAWIAWRTLRQRDEADRRSEWWRRAQWAVDKSLSSEANVKEVGEAAMRMLIDSPLADKGEAELLKAFVVDDNDSLPDLPGHLDTDTGETDTGKSKTAERTEES
ncbi:hypothetical protein [Cellulomonas sp. PhB143]|uniref:hypothetical protein n=1 Tax=Cellulomonas sp. PhB143 TaxID=2485186 RepID=UPI000F468974|nr:hypothetical protein [Cellulomonas sp. PhB143]ROS74346.1 hypothetical protein EDF32_2087 [Cellulomonas sp. PhB143]